MDRQGPGLRPTVAARQVLPLAGQREAAGQAAAPVDARLAAVLAPRLQLAQQHHAVVDTAGQLLVGVAGVRVELRPARPPRRWLRYLWRAQLLLDRVPGDPQRPGDGPDRLPSGVHLVDLSHVSASRHGVFIGHRRLPVGKPAQLGWVNFELALGGQFTAGDDRCIQPCNMDRDFANQHGQTAGRMLRERYNAATRLQQSAKWRNSREDLSPKIDILEATYGPAIFRARQLGPPHEGFGRPHPASYSRERC